MAPALDEYSHVTSYRVADRVLGDRDSLVIGNNTELYRRRDGSIGIVLHNTTVVTFYQDGAIKLDSGGYHTTTTKDRLNRYTPSGIRVFQEDFEWKVKTSDGVFQFRDGMVINPDTGIVEDFGGGVF